MEGLQILHDLVFKFGQQIVFVLVVVVERAAVQIGSAAQVVYGKAVESALLRQFDERSAQSGFRTRDAPILAQRGFVRLVCRVVRSVRMQRVRGCGRYGCGLRRCSRCDLHRFKRFHWHKLPFFRCFEHRGHY